MPLPVATALTNWPWTLSTSDCKIACPSGESALKGEPISLLAPLLIFCPLTPIFFISSSTLLSCMITPIEPVMVPGLATIFSQALAM
jgi:hypothetical protein